MRSTDESTAKFEIELANEQAKKIKQAINDCQLRFGKVMGCGTCKALQLCTWAKELSSTIESMGKYIEALQQENEQLRAQVGKPTIEQVAWIAKCICQNADEQGTFRHLIYDIMGYGKEAYQPLCEAGLLRINNSMTELTPEQVEVLKGYKVFNPDWTCRGFQYEVGKTYEENVTPNVCDRGFHFCKQAKDCFNYYTFDPNNKVAEVIALGEVAEEGDKCCTNKIQIVREISWEEVLTIVNTGKACTGLCNSGNCNSGNYNSGNWNSGDRNSGNYNSGNYNSGDWNSGDWNSGDRNSGDCNSGDWNSGNCNSGDFNITDGNSGCFCTEAHTIRFFDKPSDWTFEDWRMSEAYRLLRCAPLSPVKWIPEVDMTDEEKAEYPEYTTTGGYLKRLSLEERAEAAQEWWDSLNADEKRIIKNIPNFDPIKFKQITGIEVD